MFNNMYESRLNGKKNYFINIESQKSHPCDTSMKDVIRITRTYIFMDHFKVVRMNNTQNL